MADFISREAAYKTLTEYYHHSSGVQHTVLREALNRVPTADVVARDCYDRILAENDTMREQLAQIGKKPGDRMDDVRPVVRGEWIRGNESRTSPTKDSYICSVCGEKTLSGFCGNPAKTNFCPTCGAEMEPDEAGQRGEKDSG